MKKNNIDTLLTGDFLRMCVAHFLLFTGLFLLLPWLPMVLKQLLGVPLSQGVWLYAAFVAGMLVVGPFHAHLGDVYRRKHLFLFPAIGMAAAGLGYLYVTEWSQCCLLAFAQGACFALAMVGDLTVAIDITHSSRRTVGNLIYAWLGRMGCVVGTCLGAWLLQRVEFQQLTLVAGATVLVGCYFGLRVYVPFRAPIGVPVATLDRFLLPRAWVPAIGVVMLSMAVGRLLPLLLGGDYCPLIGLCVLAVAVIPLVRLFVRLSHHCQRGTANASCYQAMDMGLLLGLGLSYAHFDAVHIHSASLQWALIALLFLALVAYPYYRSHRLR